MENSIKINEIEIKYLIEKTKRKSICIIVKENGKVIIRAPKLVPNYKIIQFIEKKKEWIYIKYIESKLNYKEIKFEEGQNLNVLGKSYRINIIRIDKKVGKTELAQNSINFYIPKENNDVSLFIERGYNKLLLEIANIEIKDSINKWKETTKLEPKMLKIRNFKSAWGNCSSKKIISINKNLCKYSKFVIDYVCLHEICHLRYMNHSKDFWNMVRTYMPNYKLAEKELR